MTVQNEVIAYLSVMSIYSTIYNNYFEFYLFPNIFLQSKLVIAEIQN